MHVADGVDFLHRCCTPIDWNHNADEAAFADIQFDLGACVDGEGGQGVLFFIGMTGFRPRRI